MYRCIYDDEDVDDDIDELIENSNEEEQTLLNAIKKDYFREAYDPFWMKVQDVITITKDWTV
jgi:hypothetical protein